MPVVRTDWKISLNRALPRFSLWQWTKWKSTLLNAFWHNEQYFCLLTGFDILASSCPKTFPFAMKACCSSVVETLWTKERCRLMFRTCAGQMGMG